MPTRELEVAFIQTRARAAQARRWAAIPRRAAALIRGLHFALAAVVCVGCVSAGDYVAVSLRSETDSIESQLLTHTPLGSSYIEVARLINEDLKHEGGSFPARSQGERYAHGIHFLGTGEVKETDSKFVFEQIPQDTQVFDEMYEDTVWIHVLLGRYWGIPFEMWVSARYVFDRTGALVAIEVRKEADAL